MANIGGLQQDQVRMMGGKIGALLLMFWFLAMLMLTVVPMSLPHIESASFFAISHLNRHQNTGLYIPQIHLALWPSKRNQQPC